MEELLITLFGVERGKELFHACTTEKITELQELYSLSTDQLKTLTFKLGEIIRLPPSLNNPENKTDKRVHELIQKLKDRHQDKQTHGRMKSTRDKSIAMNETKERKIQVGWLKSPDGLAYTQVRLKEGGGSRDIMINLKETTHTSLLEKMTSIFIPEESHKLICKMGNFKGEVISEFKDINSMSCSFLEYMHSHGLYPSKCKMYLMTQPKESLETSHETYVEARSETTTYSEENQSTNLPNSMETFTPKCVTTENTLTNHCRDNQILYHSKSPTTLCTPSLSETNTATTIHQHTINLPQSHQPPPISCSHISQTFDVPPNSLPTIPLDFEASNMVSPFSSVYQTTLTRPGCISNTQFEVGPPIYTFPSVSTRLSSTPTPIVWSPQNSTTPNSDQFTQLSDTHVKHSSSPSCDILLAASNSLPHTSSPVSRPLSICTLYDVNVFPYTKFTLTNSVCNQPVPSSYITPTCISTGPITHTINVSSSCPGPVLSDQQILPSTYKQGTNMNRTPNRLSFHSSPHIYSPRYISNQVSNFSPVSPALSNYTPSTDSQSDLFSDEDNVHQSTSSGFFASSDKTNPSTISMSETKNSAYKLTIDGVPDTQTLTVSYVKYKQSLYDSEVVLRHVCFSTRQCYELSEECNTVSYEDYCPFNDGYVIRSISVNDCVYLDQHQKENSSEIVYKTPKKMSPKTSIIVHQPTEICGYSEEDLIIGVVISGDISQSNFRWFRDGKEVKSGLGLCCTSIKTTGRYQVSVEQNKNSYVSEFISVSKTHSDLLKLLPVVKEEDLSYTEFNLIGHGSFASVYRGSWIGTDVAIKKVKLLRQPKTAQIALRREVEILSRIRHPNIVQVLGINSRPQMVLLVLEFVDGADLETIIFDEESSVTLFNEEKPSVGIQIIKAVTYLHNINPPVIHRDIKPANVLVTKNSLVTKLCDLGLSKVKMAQTAVSTMGAPGTPAYMAPEIALEKSGGDIRSDVWYLGCTLLELFTGKDCWGDSLYADNIDAVKYIRSSMKANNLPPTITYLSSSTSKQWQNAILKCLVYSPQKRLSAKKLLSIIQKTD